MKKLLLASVLIALGSVACDNSSSGPKPLANAESSKLTDPRILSSKLEDGKGVAFEIMDAEKFAALTSYDKPVYMSGGEVYDANLGHTGEKKAKIDAAGSCRIEIKAPGHSLVNKPSVIERNKDGQSAQDFSGENKTLVVEEFSKRATQNGSFVIIRFKQHDLGLTCSLPVKPEEATWAHVQNNFGGLIRILDSDLK